MSDHLTSPAVASVHGKRAMWPVPSTARRRCGCGCKKRATHFGGNNGIALMRGCELYVRRWVRDGSKTRRAKA